MKTEFAKFVAENRLAIDSRLFAIWKTNSWFEITEETIPEMEDEERGYYLINNEEMYAWACEEGMNLEGRKRIYILDGNTSYPGWDSNDFRNGKESI